MPKNIRNVALAGEKSIYPVRKK